MTNPIFLRTASKAIVVASLATVAAGCGSAPSGPLHPATLSADQVQQSEAQVRAAAEAEAAALPAETPAR
ncbi:MAG: hypothetical protein ACKO4T_04510 [Planctomycetaceae bacterium]